MLNKLISHSVDRSASTKTTKIIIKEETSFLVPLRDEYQSSDTRTDVLIVNAFYWRY